MGECVAEDPLKAYVEGLEAYLDHHQDGLPRLSNPYEPESHKFGQWAQGWASGEEDDKEDRLAMLAMKLRDVLAASGVEPADQSSMLYALALEEPGLAAFFGD